MAYLFVVGVSQIFCGQTWPASPPNHLEFMANSSIKQRPKCWHNNSPPKQETRNKKEQRCLYKEHMLQVRLLFLGEISAWKDKRWFTQDIKDPNWPPFVRKTVSGVFIIIMWIFCKGFPQSIFDQAVKTMALSICLVTGIQIVTPVTKEMSLSLSLTLPEGQ